MLINQTEYNLVVQTFLQVPQSLRSQLLLQMPHTTRGMVNRSLLLQCLPQFRLLRQIRNLMLAVMTKAPHPHPQFLLRLRLPSHLIGSVMTRNLSHLLRRLQSLLTHKRGMTRRLSLHHLQYHLRHLPRLMLREMDRPLLLPRLDHQFHHHLR